jgi:hypothetical protein
MAYTLTRFETRTVSSYTLIENIARIIGEVDLDTIEFVVDDDAIVSSFNLTDVLTSDGYVALDNDTVISDPFNLRKASLMNNKIYYDKNIILKPYDVIEIIPDEYSGDYDLSFQIVDEIRYRNSRFELKLKNIDGSQWSQDDYDNFISPFTLPCSFRIMTPDLSGLTGIDEDIIKINEICKKYAEEVVKLYR